MRLLSLSEVSIQKRTSPGKLGKRDFEISFANVQFLAIEMAGQSRLIKNYYSNMPGKKNNNRINTLR